MAALVLLCLPGTSIAGGASDTTSSSANGSGLLQYGAGYGKAERSGVGADGAAHAAGARLAAGPGGRAVRAADRGRGHPLPISRGGRGRRCRRSGHAACAHARAEGAAPAGSRLRTARRIAAGACPPDRSCNGARASARPGGRPLRPADAGCGRTPPAVRWSPGQRRGHRPDAAEPDPRIAAPSKPSEAGGRAGQDRRAAARRRGSAGKTATTSAHRVDLRRHR